ncbi:serine hydrolase domain-containing protein [Bogoriella caseilytica]|uniref:CubicO group peptidase (Beta-lactamase class C family) n=1 Tax=Bogoriella caseilytica TaxID=56055 RepID=A0A3N2BA15_9MICO|nr:serine hydrolase domain-containing protein [Bogoriella caseilytica]ROR72038.1 CubicO group peptidase (beta-lactamase class C family) [Bogoriella caseilytica]
MSQHSSGAPSLPSSIEDALATIRGLADNDEFSGRVLVTQGEQVLADAAFGLASRRWGTPVTTTIRFDTASITKLFTAVAVLQQVDAGALALDDRIHDHVDLSGTAIPEQVTLHHLLSHTSGIADDADEEAGESYEAIWENKPNYSVTETADFLPQFVHKDPVFAPGEGCRYNNVGYVLLGLAVEKVTGKTYREVVAEQVFARAGMTDSGFFHMRDAVTDVAEGWDPVTAEDGTVTWRQNIYSYPPIGSPDGGAHVSAADLAHFLKAVQAGELLSSELTEQFLSPQALHHTDEPESPTDTAALHYAYGLEIEHDQTGQVRSYYKDGINTGASGILRYYPRLDVTVVVLANSEDGAWEPIGSLDQAISTYL